MRPHYRPLKLRRVLCSVVILGTALLWSSYRGPVVAHAAPVNYYFHGLPGNGDDGTRQTASPTATFDTVAPAGTVDSTQTGVQGLTPQPADGNQPWWLGTAVPTGPIAGTLHLETYWSSVNATAITSGMAVDIQVFTNVDVINLTGVLLGQASARFNVNATPTLNTADIAISGTVVTNFLVQVNMHFTDTGQGNTVHYNSTSAPSFFSINAGGPTPTPTATATATTTPTGGQGGPQRFYNYTYPPPMPHPPFCNGLCLLTGEPSLGVDWVTNNTMYQGGLNTWQIHFDYSVKPPTADWRDRSSSSTDQASLDARLITDHAGRLGIDDRTIVDQLAAPNSIQAYSDTDGGVAPPPTNVADWITSSGGGIPSGPDHESTGSGRYHTGTTGLPTPAYPHAVYYCSQAEVLIPQPGPIDFCARSDTGGASYGAGVQTYTQAQCGGLHGKPRVGPNGTVYLPNKDCSAAGGAGNAKGLVVSKDNGASWVVHNIPNTTVDGNQPDPDVAVGGDTGLGTVYYAYRDGDHHAKVVTSTDEGTTYSAPVDVGAFFGIQNAQFPEVIAGDQNRAAVAFIGTPTAGDDLPDAFPGVWHLYVAFTYDGGVTWQTVDATPNLPVQRGGVCMQGTACGTAPSANDRNMLDFNDENIDNQGRVQIAYTDGCTGTCETSSTGATCPVGSTDCQGKFSSRFSMVDQVCGMGLFAKYDPGFFNDPSCAALPASVPESPIAVPLVGAGFIAVTVAFIFGRRRRGRQVETG